jgi:hypothetical protein
MILTTIALALSELVPLLTVVVLIIPAIICPGSRDAPIAHIVMVHIILVQIDPWDMTVAGNANHVAVQVHA